MYFIMTVVLQYIHTSWWVGSSQYIFILMADDR